MEQSSSFVWGPIDPFTSFLCACAKCHHFFFVLCYVIYRKRGKVITVCIISLRTFPTIIEATTLKGLATAAFKGFSSKEAAGANKVAGFFARSPLFGEWEHIAPFFVNGRDKGGKITSDSQKGKRFARGTRDNEACQVQPGTQSGRAR